MDFSIPGFSTGVFPFKLSFWKVVKSSTFHGSQSVPVRKGQLVEIGSNQAFMESGWMLFAWFMNEHGPLVNVEKSAKVLEGWIAYVSCLYHCPFHFQVSIFEFPLSIKIRRPGSACTVFFSYVASKILSQGAHPKSPVQGFWILDFGDFGDFGFWILGFWGGPF